MQNPRWLLYVLAASICLTLVTGCGGERDKPVNRDLDKPKPAKPG